MSTLNSVEWGGCVNCAIITLMNILVKGKGRREEKNEDRGKKEVSKDLDIQQL